LIQVNDTAATSDLADTRGQAKLGPEVVPERPQVLRRAMSDPLPEISDQEPADGDQGW